MNVTIVDAFTRTPGAGNRAGVVLDARGLSDADMQRAAAAVAASETAFVFATTPEIQVRYFTPVTEIPFCGHATIATLHLLAERKLLEVPSRPTLVCKAGRLAVTLEATPSGTRAWIQTPLHPFQPSPIAPEQLVALLGGDPRILDPSLPILRAGPKLYVPVTRRNDIWSLAPRYHALEAAGRERDLHGFYIFTRDVLEAGSAVHARFFAPAMGVREDPVTGSASGPVGAYLAAHGVAAAPVRLRAEQGDAMGKPGRVDIDVVGQGRAVESVRIGGLAVTVLDGVLAAQ
jgi:PhzF family phenazine biosynthesis protein